MTCRYVIEELQHLNGGSPYRTEGGTPYREVALLMETTCLTTATTCGNLGLSAMVKKKLKCSTFLLFEFNHLWRKGLETTSGGSCYLALWTIPPTQNKSEEKTVRLSYKREKNVNCHILACFARHPGALDSIISHFDDLSLLRKH